MTGATGKPRPETLKVNMGYRAGFVGEIVFTYTWPNAYAKAQRGLEFLRNRLARVWLRGRTPHRETSASTAGAPGRRRRGGGNARA